MLSECSLRPYLHKPLQKFQAFFMKKVYPDLRLSEKEIVVGMLIFVILVIVLYVWYFVGKAIVPVAEKWGQFGDYFGGVLNPAVAMAALLLLARSVGIQRTELMDVRETLRGQAQSAADTAELAALTSLINAALAETHMHRDYLQFLVQQISAQDQLALHRHQAARYSGILDNSDGFYKVHTVDGKTLSRDAAIRQLALINERVTVRMVASQSFENEIQIILDARRAANRKQSV
jgi:hypothetical protein